MLAPSASAAGALPHAAAAGAGQARLGRRRASLALLLLLRTPAVGLLGRWLASSPPSRFQCLPHPHAPLHCNPCRCSYNYYVPASILGLKLDGGKEDAARLQLLRTAWERFQGTHVGAGLCGWWGRRRGRLLGTLGLRACRQRVHTQTQLPPSVG